VGDEHQLQVFDFACDLSVFGEVEVMIDAAVKKYLVLLVDDQ
jgi:hypothetical protein